MKLKLNLELYIANLFALLSFAFIIGSQIFYFANFPIIYILIFSFIIFYFYNLKIGVLFFCFASLGFLYVLLWNELSYIVINFLQNASFLLNIIQIYRNFIESKVLLLLPLPYADIFNGILFGTPFRDYNLKKNFIDSGLIHITAVSGQNLTLMFSIVYELFKTTKFFSFNFLFYISTAVIFFFVLIMGFEGNVIRAALMGFLVILVKNKFGRLLLKRNLIIFSLLLFVIFKPNFVLEDLGAQFSFLAITGIFYITPIIYQKLFFIKNNSLKQIISETLGAQLIVLPLLVYYFSNLNLFSIFANALVLPLMSWFLTLATFFLFVPWGYLAFLTLPILWYIKIVAVFFSKFVLYFHLPLSFVIVFYILLLIKIIKWHKNDSVDFYFNIN